MGLAMSIDENEEEDGEDAGSSTPDGLGLLSRRMPADDPTAGVGTRDLLRPQSQPAPDEAEVESQAEQGEIPPSPSPEAEGETLASAPSAEADSDAPGSVPSAEGEGDTPGDAGEEHAQADFVSDLEGKADSARSSTWLIRSTARTADDPLLGCLTILCKLLDRPVSADALTAGLPLVDGRVTPPLFVRAASRVGIAARLTRRPLDSITSMALPCVLHLEGRRSCVLTRIEQGSSAEIALPDMGAGSRSVPIAELESEYISYALFARPEFQFDTRSEDIRTADPKGWFWGTLVSSWKIYVEVVIAALLVNSFALASPLFIMNVYDRVVPNAAIETLWVLALGAATVFGFDFLLKMLRSYFVDVAGKTADTRIGARLFQQVLGMKMADRPASAGELASNLREFEHLRDFFTSSTLTAIVDFSFALLFIFIISIIGGAKIALIPLVAMLPIMIVGMIVQIPLR